jgi:hypothetical protein
LKDLVLRIAIEPRDVVIDGAVRTMTRAERVLRLTVQRAVDGEVRALAQMMKIMKDTPDLAASVQTETVYFINGPLANA